MAKDSHGKEMIKDKELKKRLSTDNYMGDAVCECYASFKNVIKQMVTGKNEKEWVVVASFIVVFFYIFIMFLLVIEPA